MANDYNRYRDWLAQIEHGLIERGMSSNEATQALSENESSLKGKYGDSVAVQVAADEMWHKIR